MDRSKFPFVSDTVLRNNLDDTFSHIVHLVSIIDSTNYPIEAKSAFCKSVIIHTGSIIEALLMEMLKKSYTDDEVKTFYASWKLVDPKTIYKIDDDNKIVSGQYRLTLGDGISKLNLGQISNFLRKHKVISNDIHEKIDKVRKLRNEQHLSTHNVVKKYSKKQLEFVFEVAREVKELTKNKLS